VGQRSLWIEAFTQWKQDKASQWRHPSSWWNLLILLPVLAWVLWSVHNSMTDLEIAKRQRATVAIISSHDPPNHDRYGYTFFVNKAPYTGWAFPSDKIDYSLGKQIVIHYDPIDPAHNLPESFEEAGVRGLVFAPFYLLIIAGLPLFIFFQRSASSKGR
jgi:hypothetical protein